MDNTVQEELWETFTTALEENNVSEAEFLLEATNDFAGEAAWEEVVLKMYDEFTLWLIGKSEYNG